MANGYEINGKWIDCESGQKYVAKAITTKGRILAIASLDVPIEIGVDFSSYFGSENLKTEIESAGKEQVQLIAEATPER